MTSPDDLSGIAKALAERIRFDACLGVFATPIAAELIEAALRLQREAGRREVMSGKLTLQQIAAAQGVKPLTDIRDLAGGLPDDFEIPVGHSAEADVLRLRTALHMYGQHLATCDTRWHEVSPGHCWSGHSDRPCTCGFAAVSEGGTDVTPR
jgi:hypothetical protein